MTIAQVATAGSLRSDIVATENEERQLHEELERASRETLEAHSAGSALLSAVEAAMAPLMAELAAARKACGEADLTKAFAGEGADAAPMRALLGENSESLEADIRHLSLDITHYQDRAEALQAEERQRSHELQRLRGELERAAEELSYERQRHSSFKVAECGPGGTAVREMNGRRQETDTQQNLRIAAEQRAARLAKDIMRLANDTDAQQATIEQLTKRLDQARKAAGEHEGKLATVVRASQVLKQRLSGEGTPVGAEGGDEGQRTRSLKKNKTSVSTGKLPHLSF